MGAVTAGGRPGAAWSSPLRCPPPPETKSGRTRCRQPLCSADSWTPGGVWAGWLWSRNPPGHSYCSPTRRPGRQEVSGQKLHRDLKTTDKEESVHLATSQLVWKAIKFLHFKCVLLFVPVYSANAVVGPLHLSL